MGCIILHALLIAAVVAPSAILPAAFGFQSPFHPSATRNKIGPTTHPSKVSRFDGARGFVAGDGRRISTALDMVRNVDLPEALVFYGAESVMTRPVDDAASCELRPGIARLLGECREVGTAALLLSEEIEDEGGLKLMFRRAWERSSELGIGKMPETLVEGDDPVIRFRCVGSKFVVPSGDVDDENSDADESDEYDESIEFYNLLGDGRSPSPAFLLDSLCSVRIDPRGFGGSSGFGRGQWIEPRRIPMPARAVVFIAGDWDAGNDGSAYDERGEKSTGRDRCAAARAAGCRLIYLEQSTDETGQGAAVEDDMQTMALCDAVIDTFGNDNPRDLQPITLDAISTPGDYWLNPPSPRDDGGNRVAADEIVEWFRSEREMDAVVGDEGCVVIDEEEENEKMSEEEMNKILADLDGL